MQSKMKQMNALPSLVQVQQQMAVQVVSQAILSWWEDGFDLLSQIYVHPKVGQSPHKWDNQYMIDGPRSGTMLAL
jgi:hypothetical protein